MALDSNYCPYRLSLSFSLHLQTEASHPGNPSQAAELSFHSCGHPKVHLYKILLPRYTQSLKVGQKLGDSYKELPLSLD